MEKCGKDFLRSYDYLIDICFGVEYERCIIFMLGIKGGIIKSIIVLVVISHNNLLKKS